MTDGRRPLVRSRSTWASVRRADLIEIFVVWQKLMLRAQQTVEQQIALPCLGALTPQDQQ